MYVDASAISAILKNEPERAAFVATIKTVADPVTSVVSAFEAALALSTLTGSCSSAVSEVSRFLKTSGITLVPIEESCLIELGLARDRYGKGTGHPAQLNLGDCVSYAVAKTRGIPLLYKGNDFALTDLG